MLGVLGILNSKEGSVHCYGSRPRDISKSLESQSGNWTDSGIWMTG